MKPKQEATMKNPKDISAAEKRLLKWIAIANSATGAVTYTQVKTFLDLKQERALKSCDTKFILTHLVEKEYLVKVGYKYLTQVPTISRAKKSSGVVPSVMKRVVNLPKPLRKIPESTPVIKLKRPHEILNVNDVTSIQNRTTEDACNSEVPMDAATDTTVTEGKDVKVMRSAGTLDVRDEITDKNSTMEGTEDVSNFGVLWKNMDAATDTTVTEVKDVKVMMSVGILDVRDGITSENPTMEGTEESKGVLWKCMDAASDMTVTEDKDVKVMMSAENLDVHDVTTAENPVKEGSVDVSDVDGPLHSQSMDVSTDTTKSENIGVMGKKRKKMSMYSRNF